MNPKRSLDPGIAGRKLFITIVYGNLGLINPAGAITR